MPTSPLWTSDSRRKMPPGRRRRNTDTENGREYATVHGWIVHTIMDFRQQKKNATRQAAQKYSYRELQGERRPSWMDRKEQPETKKRQSGVKEETKDQTPQKTAKDDPELQKMIEEFRKSR